MTITLPLEKSSFLSRFAGKEAVLARNILPDVRIDKIGRIVFKDDGTYSGDAEGTVEMPEDGQLVLNDKYGKPVYSFRGAETRNRSTFLVGEPYLEAHFSGFSRCLLYEFVPLADFRVCISTHKSYMAETMTRILRSLAKANFPKDRTLVVVGGADENEETVVDGCKTVLTKSNYDGLTALAALSQDYDGYWLLLHDTCEVMDDFQSTMGKLDVGLNFDRVVSFNDIGLYSSSFVRRLVLGGVFGRPSPETWVVSLCSLWSNGGVCSRHVATKDVYGIGTKRDVLYLDDIGVKKYRRAKGVAAKP